MKHGKSSGASLKATGGVGKGWFVSDKSTTLSHPSVDKDATRSAVATNKKVLGPRTA